MSRVIGTGIIILRLEGCRSLKEKRKTVRSLITRLKNAFNASVAETGELDCHDRAEIGFAAIGNDRRVINAKIDKIFNLAEDVCPGLIIHTELEIISL